MRCSIVVTLLHCALASCGAVYCNRSCLSVCVCLCVCGSVTTITRNCVHRSSPNWVVGKCSDHLRLTKFWPYRVPGKGSAAGRNFFSSALLQPARGVCVSFERYFTFSFLWTSSLKYSPCVCANVEGPKNLGGGDAGAPHPFDGAWLIPRNTLLPTYVAMPNMVAVDLTVRA